MGNIRRKGFQRWTAAPTNRASACHQPPAWWRRRPPDGLFEPGSYQDLWRFIKIYPATLISHCSLVLLQSGQEYFVSEQSFRPLSRCWWLVGVAAGQSRISTIPDPTSYCIANLICELFSGSHKLRHVVTSGQLFFSLFKLLLSHHCFFIANLLQVFRMQSLTCWITFRI